MENILLVRAESHRTAREDATRIEQRDTAIEDPTYTVDGKPAAWRFVGVRKTVLCQDHDLDPFSGEEVTYSEMQVSCEGDLEKFMEGERVCVFYENDGAPPGRVE